jgi:hypothetical protein
MVYTSDLSVYFSLYLFVLTDDDGDEGDEGDDDEVKFVEDDLTGIDASNIIPSGSRRASALRSGLAVKRPAVAVPSSSSSSSSAPKAASNFKAKAIADDDEEAEF